MPSNRSKNPPWPGNKVPESLMPALRLSQDSNRSPMKERMQTNKEKMAITHHDLILPIPRALNQSQYAKIKPPKTPSHVFPGLMVGANL